ncbi:MAG TPA: zf-TFIIB domain-containing protein [Cyclobacteriaceae bacterium]|nr:zf-TFIIB domain-containing protein [Cyclobacteriaceae bacterium]HRW98461.1 zf-TFIIB domain-containing protein [Cyclobacteriaceae bacterium]
MNCPVDQSPLSRKIYEDAIEIDLCDTCGGVWLDKGELEKIQDIRVNDYSDELKMIPDYVGKSILLAKSKSASPVHCPVCSQVLERREYGYGSQVMIDSCVKGHGVWLDKGELKDLELFYERSRVDTAKMRKGFLRGLLG